MSSKKTVLKVTPNAPASSQQKVKRKNDYLRECINTILKRELLHLNVKKVFDILVNDLNISLKNVSPRLKYVLSECLCYYMKMWPGWQKYEVVCTNERSKMEYIEKFKEYLIFKINYIIENERVFNPDVANPNENRKVSQEVQTDPINKKNKPEAPYNLVISGQPNVLNNIVFIEMDNNVIIKQHAEKPWRPLNVAEFLNYSFVYVSIKLPDIELSRSNLHEFQRYITECGDTASCPAVEFIAYIRKISNNSKPKVYTMEYIHAYCKQFLEIIKKVPGINAIKISELEEVFRQFIMDIKESNVFSCTGASGNAVHTMATDTSVCFNIGGKTYIRNKKMVVNNENQRETNAINFCEVLIPRMAYTLDRFTAEEDVTSEDTSFKSLNEISLHLNKNSPELFKFIEAVNSSVSYQCLLCPKIYFGDRAYIDILDHYRFLHKGEQSVLCFNCRKQFAIAKLAGNRWSHDCGFGSESTKETSVSVDPNISNTQTAAAATTSSIGINDLLAKTTEHVPKTPRPTIGINEILSSTKSTISLDDLLNTSSVKVVTPVNSISNNFNTPNIVYTQPTTTFIGSLPVVRSIPSTNTTMPTTSVLLAITSGSIGTSNIVSAPIVSSDIIPSSIPAPIIQNTTDSILPSMNEEQSIVKNEFDISRPEIVGDIDYSNATTSTTLMSSNEESVITSMTSGVNTNISTTPIILTQVNNVPINIVPVVDANASANPGVTLVNTEPVISASTNTVIVSPAPISAAAILPTPTLSSS